MLKVLRSPPIKTPISFSFSFRSSLTYLNTELFFFKYTILFICGSAGSSLLCGLFSSCGEQRLLSSCGARGSLCRGFLWSMGSTASGFQ